MSIKQKHSTQVREQKVKSFINNYRNILGTQLEESLNFFSV